MALVFDTAMVEPHERFDFWVEGAVRAFFPMTLRRGDGRNVPFDGSVRQHQVGPMTVTRVVSGPTTISRTRAEIAAHDPETIQLSFLLRGHSVFAQGDRELVLSGSGDIVMHDTSRPYAIRSALPIEFVVLEFPRSLLGAGADWACAHTVEPIRSELARGLIAPFVIGLADGLDRGTVGESDAELGEGALDLVRALFRPPGPRDASVRAETSAALLSRVKHHIREHLRNDDLRPDTIAAAHFVSTRSLQKLFQAEGLTVTDWIRDRRLDAARRDLCNPDLRAETITRIAGSWGLMNAAHFSRSFRARYGMSPRQARRRRPARARTSPTRPSKTRAEGGRSVAP